MTDMEMATAALQMLRDYQPKDHVVVSLEFSTACHQPDLIFYYHNDANECIRADFYSDTLSDFEDFGEHHFGSFEEGFKRLEELING